MLRHLAGEHKIGVFFAQPNSFFALQRTAPAAVQPKRGGRGRGASHWRADSWRGFPTGGLTFAAVASTTTADMKRFLAWRGLASALIAAAEPDPAKRSHEVDRMRASGRSSMPAGQGAETRRARVQAKRMAAPLKAGPRV